MLKAFFIFIASLALLMPQVMAQEKTDNGEKCIGYGESPSGNVIENRCDYALNIELFNTNNDQLSEHDLLPGETMPLPRNGFGAACRKGYRSETPVTPENRMVFRGDGYKCREK